MTTALPGPAAPRSPAVARLVQFTEQLHSSVGRLESLAMVNGHPDLLDSDRVALVGLGEDLLELRQRTERPEVRVLVLGPLKAGKSTFMNALVRRADASQVSVLPAFPCYVEVRDVERDSSGHPTQPERSVLYNRGGKPVEQLTLADCQLRLDELLRAYLRADSPAVKARLQDSCTRVTQFIDLGGSPEGLDVTLVDSPGLFFDTTVDDEILRSTQATTPTATDNSVEYSSVSRSLYGLADV